MKRRSLLLAGASLLTFPRLVVGADAISVDDARALARTAFIYAFPMVENYLSIYQFALDPSGSQYKGPPNAIHNVARVFTPKDTGVVTPNSDTPYSFFIMDLRAEPLVVSLPKIEPDRYYSLQLVDLYSHNVDYVGTRKDGNEGGDFLVSGPDWEGNAPAGVKRVIRMPTQIIYSQFRTQLYDANDLPRVQEIQSGYGVKPLSAYKGTEAPPAPPVIDWPPITRETAGSDFWSFANFLLQFAPPLAWENELRASFGRIGVAPAAEWPATELSTDVSTAVINAGTDALVEIRTKLIQEVTSSRGLFGSPEEMKGKYMERALGAMGGLYGLQEEEALYETYLLDAAGERLDTSKQNYVMKFGPNSLPPSGAFWSITMYDGNQFLVENSLDRYLINSGMASQLKKSESGEVTIYLRKDSPGAELENNWLPAPDGEMGVVMRIYLPLPEALNGTWKAPKIEPVGRG